MYPIQPAEKRALIYDDDPDILEICSILLQARGFEVKARSNCVNVLNDVAAFEPTVIVMDNWLPETGGVEAVKLLKKSAYSHVPVVFFSANTQVEELAKEAGAEFMIKKPFDVDSFTEIIEQAHSVNRSN